MALIVEVVSTYEKLVYFRRLNGAISLKAVICRLFFVSRESRLGEIGLFLKVYNGAIVKNMFEKLLTPFTIIARILRLLFLLK